MRKVKAFFYILLHSLIPNQEYYKKITKTHFSFSFKYLIGLILLLNLVLVTSIASHYSYNKIKKINISIISSLKEYPNDLIISVKDNILFTTFDHPYFFWLKDDDKRKLFLVVDQSAENNKIDVYKSNILMTPTSIVFHIGDKNKILPLSLLNGISINKDEVNKWLLNLENINKNLPFYYCAFTILLFVLLFTFSLIATLIYLFVVSLIAYFFFKTIQKRHFHFKKVIQISFHANTFPYVLDYFFLSIPFSIKIPYSAPFAFESFPIIFLFILVIFTIVGVREAYHER
jgi:hypothetical protein